MNLFEKLFSSNEFSTGALISPRDPRDVPVSALQQAPVTLLPKEYFSDISWFNIKDQKRTSSCTAAAHSLIKEWHLQEEGKDIPISTAFLYTLSKQIDGIPDELGTFPRSAASVSINTGCASEAIAKSDFTLPDEVFRKLPITTAMKNDAAKNKNKGYAYVEIDEIALKEAIFRYKFVEVTLRVGDWSRARVYPPSLLVPRRGNHRVVLYGWDRKYIYFVNSWGTGWGDDGIGKFKWKDYKDNNVLEPMVYTAIPQPILEEYKSNMAPKNIMKWAMAIQKHEGWFVPGSKGFPRGSLSFQNNNPGNLRYAKQALSTGEGKGGFAKFATYEDGFKCLTDMLIRCASGKNKIYKATMTLTEFFRTYAPTADNNNPDAYAKFVAKEIGVPASTQIKSLL